MVLRGETWSNIVKNRPTTSRTLLTNPLKCTAKNFSSLWAVSQILKQLMPFKFDQTKGIRKEMISLAHFVKIWLDLVSEGGFLFNFFYVFNHRVQSWRQLGVLAVKSCFSIFFWQGKFSITFENRRTNLAKAFHWKRWELWRLLDLSIALILSKLTIFTSVCVNL